MDDEFDDFSGDTGNDNGNSGSSGGDIVDDLLQAQGIQDRDHVKYEENGEIVDKRWDDLDRQDQLNILKTPTYLQGPQISNEESSLISSIRGSGMTPSEYLNYVQNQAAEAAASTPEVQHYQVDDLNDDELFAADFISRMGDVTDQETAEALDKAKSNPTLFEKQVNAIRDEYRRAEAENITQAQLEQQQMAQEQYNQYANSIASQINNLHNISGFDLNLDQRDATMLYDFLTGADAAGHNYFQKAMADPATLVKAAWFTLNGDQMLQDINNYYQQEMAYREQAAYNQGYQQRSKERGSVVYKPTKSSNNDNANIDDF